MTLCGGILCGELDFSKAILPPIPFPTLSKEQDWGHGFFCNHLEFGSNDICLLQDLSRITLKGIRLELQWK